MGIREEVIEVVAQTLDVRKEELKETERLYDSVGVDSTEMVEVVNALNKQFGIKLTTNDITKFSTPEEIIKIVESKKEGA